MITHVYHPPASHQAQRRGDPGRHVTKGMLESERQKDIAFLFKGRKPEKMTPVDSNTLVKDLSWKKTNGEMMSLRRKSK